jgi:excisionase family DNA binding protein
LSSFSIIREYKISKRVDPKMPQSGSAGSPATGEKFLTLREAADVLRLSTRTLREYLKRGEIRGKLIGKRWRFKRADLDAFFENAPSDWDFVRKHGDGD